MEKILILDAGSQYTKLIARRIREIEVYCEVVPCFKKLGDEELADVRGIIVSGGPASVLSGELKIDDSIIGRLPILGICYGMQWLTHTLGGVVESGEAPEYGQAKISVKGGELFADLPESFEVWMSHGDHVASPPPGCRVNAKSDDVIVSFEDPERRIYGLQFHPEVSHTTNGIAILKNFIFKVCGLAPNWNSAEIYEEAVAKISAKVSDTEDVLCAVSGGVDSTVAAVITKNSVKNLHCIFVDNGLLRQDEGPQVYKFLTELGLKVNFVDASERFLNGLAGVTDPETKRKVIGRTFIEVFDDFAKSVANPTYLVQGTLYPDVIESVSSIGPSVTIKSHHNVGGLPEHMKLKLIEPLRELFKDEVRRLGESIGIGHQFLYRQPFPGPGLAVRIIGEVTRDKLAILRASDAILQEELAKHNFPIWQAFAVMTGINSVGVMGDGRSYDHCIGIRMVESVDGMTANWFFPGEKFLRNVSSRITNEVKGVNRVVLDISNKPPATIEWE